VNRSSSTTFSRSLLDAMATRDLRRLQLAWTAASVGGWVFFIVLAVYAYDQGGAAAVGVAALARMLPAAAAAPVAGVIVDRRSRRDVLLAITIGRALVLAGIAAAVAADAPLAIVLGLGTVFTALATAHKPAQAALLPALAHSPRQLAASNAVWTAVDSAGFLVGSLLGGVLVATTSLETAFVVTAGVFAAAAWPFARLPRDPIPEYREHEEAEPRLEELASGFRTVIGDRSLRLLVGTLSVSTLVEGAADVLVVLAAIELLDLGGAGVGWLNSAWGFGGLVGGAAAISLLSHGRLAAGLAGGCLLVGVPLTLIAALPEVWMAVAMLAVLGVGYSLIETAGLTLLQRLTADDVLGRAFAVVESSYWLTTGVGAILAPVLVSLLGIRGALLAVGACLPVLAALRWAGLARFEAGRGVPVRPFELLRSMPLFAPLPLCTVETVCCRVTEIECGPGDSIVREGEAGDRFFVIAEGVFDVSCTRGTFPPLGGGDIFGEIALLRDVPRTATVTARTEGLLYALDREAFQLVIGGHRFCRRTAQSMVDERLERLPQFSTK
jgi:MFS family permease